MDTVSKAEDLIRQAWALMMPAERMNLRHPDLMASCSKAFRLYAEALYGLVGLEFPRDLLPLDGQQGDEAKEVLSRETKRLSEVSLPLLFPYSKDLPKVVVLAFFWATFSEYAAAACQGAGLGQGAVFGKNEASYAASEAKQCHKIVKSLIDLKKG
jgi:hypothetical protein